MAIVVTMFIRGAEPEIYHTSGLIEGWITPFEINGAITILINVVTTILAAFIFGKIASQFSLVKDTTLLPYAFVLLLQLLHPQLTSHIAPQNLVTTIIGILFFILYTSYQEKVATEKGFVIGLLFAITALFYARALYLLPIFILGLFQMQAGSLRTVAALIIGLITPYWIIWGLGWIDMAQFTLSHLAIPLQIPLLSIPTIFVMILGLLAGTTNLINNYNENIKTRAMNGFVNLLSVYIAVLMIIDNAHYTSYLPLLDSVVALQLAYLFTTQHKRIYTILFFALIILLLGFQVWMYWI